MIFIDASFYLSLLNPKDNNHKKALEIGKEHEEKEQLTTQMVLGEVLTVGAQRFDKSLTIKFVAEILKSNTRIVLEKTELLKKAFLLFQKIRSKNISWVDCYSLVVMKELKIEEALTFDRDFKKYKKLA